MLIMTALQIFLSEMVSISPVKFSYNKKIILLFQKILKIVSRWKKIWIAFCLMRIMMGIPICWLQAAIYNFRKILIIINPDYTLMMEKAILVCSQMPYLLL